jgi:3-oxoacyl-[acyl-carrier protein] reductase
MYNDIRGKAVVVTGAGRNIGRAISLAFGREGAQVVAVDINLQEAQETARLVGGRAIHCDVADEAGVEGMLEKVGPVDVLVNNAAIFPNTPLVKMEAVEFDRVFEVNVRGVFLCSRAVARQMVARGAGGAIVCISSGAGERGARIGAAHYCASKAAVNMLVRVMAIELGPHNVRVNAVAPGLVREEPVRWPGPPDKPYFQAELNSIPMRRIGTYDEVAKAVLWLSSEQSSFVTGDIINVSGGAYVGRSHLPHEPVDLSRSGDFRIPKRSERPGTT